MLRTVLFGTLSGGVSLRESNEIDDKNEKKAEGKFPFRTR